MRDTKLDSRSLLASIVLQMGLNPRGKKMYIDRVLYIQKIISTDAASRDF
jgi:hypothetical protein